MTCAFFGHGDAPFEIRDKLKETIIKVIEEYSPDTFLVGNQGIFDRMTAGILSELREIYGFEYCVVLAYFPGPDKHIPGGKRHPTTYPEGLEKVPPRYAIYHRNKWIVDRADIMIAYVNHSLGGAAKFVKMAAKKGIKIINIGTKNPNEL